MNTRSAMSSGLCGLSIVRKGPTVVGWAGSSAAMWVVTKLLEGGCVSACEEDAGPDAADDTRSACAAKGTQTASKALTARDTRARGFLVTPSRDNWFWL